MSDNEHVRNLEKAIFDGDIAGMAQSIGELHAQWASLDGATQCDVMKLEAIFLSMLQARVKVQS